ncbi:MAG TPA: hypothetical protein VLG40_01215 [Candidatus Saccharimonas sp.]|nr:hypothetical protein [Candidatus Saccharimonas sp.]
MLNTLRVIVDGEPRVIDIPVVHLSGDLWDSHFAYAPYRGNILSFEYALAATVPATLYGRTGAWDFTVMYTGDSVSARVRVTSERPAVEALGVLVLELSKALSAVASRAQHELDLSMERSQPSFYR